MICIASTININTNIRNENRTSPGRSVRLLSPLPRADRKEIPPSTQKAISIPRRIRTVTSNRPEPCWWTTSTPSCRRRCPAAAASRTTEGATAPEAKEPDNRDAGRTRRTRTSRATTPRARDPPMSRGGPFTSIINNSPRKLRRRRTPWPPTRTPKSTTGDFSSPKPCDPCRRRRRRRTRRPFSTGRRRAIRPSLLRRGRRRATPNGSRAPPKVRGFVAIRRFKRVLSANNAANNYNNNNNNVRRRHRRSGRSISRRRRKTVSRRARRCPSPVPGHPRDNGRVPSPNRDRDRAIAARNDIRGSTAKRRRRRASPIPPRSASGGPRGITPGSTAAGRPRPATTPTAAARGDRVPRR
mmetsp:Transcript_19498/g.40814  ORF Transcript_19498/g.40814 Transcript_19498/m.40814 type:complete len:355 (+) Transcript_19498:1043-2107(+)